MNIFLIFINVARDRQIKKKKTKSMMQTECRGYRVDTPQARRRQTLFCYIYNRAFAGKLHTPQTHALLKHNQNTLCSPNMRFTHVVFCVLCHADSGVDDSRVLIPRTWQ